MFDEEPLGLASADGACDAAGIRAALVFCKYGQSFRPIRGDTLQYMAYAWNLVHHGIFSGAAKGASVVLAGQLPRSRAIP